MLSRVLQCDPEELIDPSLIQWRWSASSNAACQISTWNPLLQDPSCHVLARVDERATYRGKMKKGWYRGTLDPAVRQADPCPRSRVPDGRRWNPAPWMREPYCRGALLSHSAAPTGRAPDQEICSLCLRFACACTSSCGLLLASSKISLVSL